MSRRRIFWDIELVETIAFVLVEMAPRPKCPGKVALTDTWRAYYPCSFQLDNVVVKDCH